MIGYYNDHKKQSTLLIAVNKDSDILETIDVKSKAEAKRICKERKIRLSFWIDEG